MEVHTVVTGDGYILTMHRIQRRKQPSDTSQQDLLCQGGVTRVARVFAFIPTVLLSLEGG